MFIKSIASVLMICLAVTVAAARPARAMSGTESTIAISFGTIAVVLASIGIFRNVTQTTEGWVSADQTIYCLSEDDNPDVYSIKVNDVSGATVYSSPSKEKAIGRINYQQECFVYDQVLNHEGSWQKVELAQSTLK